jgi:hypothetical protein
MTDDRDYQLAQLREKLKAAYIENGAVEHVVRHLRQCLNERDIECAALRKEIGQLRSALAAHQKVGA